MQAELEERRNLFTTGTFSWLMPIRGHVCSTNTHSHTREYRLQNKLRSVWQTQNCLTAFATQLLACLAAIVKFVSQASHRVCITDFNKAFCCTIQVCCIQKSPNSSTERYYSNSVCADEIGVCFCCRDFNFQTCMHTDKRYTTL